MGHGAQILGPCLRAGVTLRGCVMGPWRQSGCHDIHMARFYQMKLLVHIVKNKNGALQ